MQFLIVKQILLVSLFGMYGEQYGEYAYWCKGVKDEFPKAWKIGKM